MEIKQVGKGFEYSAKENNDLIMRTNLNNDFGITKSGRTYVAQVNYKKIVINGQEYILNIYIGKVNNTDKPKPKAKESNNKMLVM